MEKMMIELCDIDNFIVEPNTDYFRLLSKMLKSVDEIREIFGENFQERYEICGHDEDCINLLTRFFIKFPLIPPEISAGESKVLSSSEDRKSELRKISDELSEATKTIYTALISKDFSKFKISCKEILKRQSDYMKEEVSTLIGDFSTLLTENASQHFIKEIDNLFYNQSEFRNLLQPLRSKTNAATDGTKKNNKYRNRYEKVLHFCQSITFFCLCSMLSINVDTKVKTNIQSIMLITIFCPSIFYMYKIYCSGLVDITNNIRNLDVYLSEMSSKSITLKNQTKGLLFCKSEPNTMLSLIEQRCQYNLPLCKNLEISIAKPTIDWLQASNNLGSSSERLGIVPLSPELLRPVRDISKCEWNLNNSHLNFFINSISDLMNYVVETETTRSKLSPDSFNSAIKFLRINENFKEMQDISAKINKIISHSNILISLSSSESESLLDFVNNQMKMMLTSLAIEVEIKIKNYLKFHYIRCFDLYERFDLMKSIIQFNNLLAENCLAGVMIMLSLTIALMILMIFKGSR
ncbi:MAG: hypothetical protein MHMPM18_000812 [Marteilia pararefringens]